MMFGLLPSLKAKKKRPHEDHSHPKRSKIDGPNPTKNPIQFETTLSPPIQEALCKFREASEQELLRLRKEGMDPSTAINKLVEKMRTVESNEDPQPRFTRQELELVMEIAGVNEEGATRALILRSELAKLRHDGFNHPEAINELSRRMKRLAGSKRRGSSSVDKGIEGKHRRREKDTNHTHNTNTTTTTTTSTTPPTSRVSFNSFDPLDDFDFLIPPGTRYIPIPTSTTTTLTPTPTSAATATPDTQTPLSTLSINRKRLQDALMLDGGRYGLLRKRQKYDKDISESDSDNENENESESEGDHYAFFDEGEFSHDDEKLDEEDDGEDDIFPPIGSLHHYSSSSSEGEGEERGMEDEGEGEWQSHLLFNEIKEEESDSDDRAWRLAPPSITSPISPSRSHSSTTTTTTTTTTSSSSPSSSYLFSSSTPSPPPTPPHAHSHSSSSSTRTNATRTTKRRDTSTPSSSSSSSSRVLSHRTKS